MFKDLRKDKPEEPEQACGCGDSGCCGSAPTFEAGNAETAGACCSPPVVHDLHSEAAAPVSDEACCGAPPGPPSGPDVRPGYSIQPYVQDFIDTPAGRAPRVRPATSWRDKLGAALARIGVSRGDYRVAPGLYCVGGPGPDSPVLASANYKLSFDALRKELAGLDAWILVLDSRGINVWCAAGKGLFSTDEMARSLRASGMERVVNHREIIVPQLGATGVAAHEVKKRSGFKVVYGPVRAADIMAFLDNNKTADQSMRRVTFGFFERMALTPVELYLLGKYLIWLVPLLFVLSGIGPGVFSPQAAWGRGLVALAALLAGIIGGAVLSPALLPWLPGRSFGLKGAPPGILLGLATSLWLASGAVDVLAATLWAAVVSSYLSMNFTGATPYTSPSGVEKEMKLWLPIQAFAVLAALVLWMASPFISRGI